jgi:hypothetical protein
MPFSRSANRPGRGDERAAVRAKAAGPSVIVDRLPAIELAGPFGERG